jgi:hypothetical protein
MKKYIERNRKNWDLGFFGTDLIFVTEKGGRRN